MADDPARLLVEEVHAKLVELQEDTSVLLVFTQLKAKEHSRPPRIVWAYGPRERVGTERVGGANAALCMEVQTFAVAIWHDDHGSCRLTLHNLERALEIVALGPNHVVGTFDWDNEKRPSWMVGGELLVGTVALKLPVVRTPTPVLKTITGHAHAVMVGDEEVC